MTLYPSQIEQRLGRIIQALGQRVAKLESRTAGIDSGMPLGLLPGVIASTYTTGDPAVVVNGAAAASGPYKYLASYTPAANDAVILAPVGGTTRAYIVLGKLSA